MKACCLGTNFEKMIEKKLLILCVIAGFFQIAYGENLDINIYKRESDTIYNTIRVSGMGGTGTVFPANFETLLFNSAGLSGKIQNREEPIFMGISVDSFFRPEYIVPIFSGITKSDNPVGTILINAKELITSSGVGASVGFGFGFMPEKTTLGFGVHGGISVFLNGKPFPLGTEGYIKMSVNFPLAYGWNVFSSEKNRLDLGVNFHPEIAVIKGLNGSDIDALSGGTTTVGKLISDAVDNPYYSFPFDFGAIYSFLGKPYRGAEIRIAFNGKNFLGNYFGPGNKIVPLKKEIILNLGTGLYLPFEIFTVKSSCLLSAEFYDINQIFIGYSDFWKSLRLGAEINVGNVVFLRGGLNSGYPSIGAEVRFLGFGVGFSWETIEKGLYIGDNPLSVLRLAVEIY